MWGAGLRTPPNLRVVKAIASPLRAQILGLLARGPMSYTEIMRSLGLSPDRDAGKFAYHLKMLVNTGLVRQNSDGGRYEITDLGRLAHGILEGLEDRLSPRRRKMVVRTSRLAMEEFQREKIAEALVREAEVPVELANRIAREAEQRLLVMRVRYLTAPLIRELVNAILLENGLEEYRHKMTRVGMPVYDVSQLLGNSSSSEVARAAKERVLAEYALIGVLYRDVADAHLSGSLHIEGLGHWPLGPSSIYHDLRPVLASGSLPSEAPSLAKAPSDLEEALTALELLVAACSGEVGREQVIPFFNFFLAPFADGARHEEIAKAIKRFLPRLASLAATNGNTVTLAIQLATPKGMTELEVPGPGGHPHALSELGEEAGEIAKAVLEAFSELHMPLRPLGLVIHLGNREGRQDEELLMAAHQLAHEVGFPVLTGMEEVHTRAFDGSLQNPDWTGDWELDVLRTGRVGRVVLNLPRLAYEARGDLEKAIRGLGELLEIAVKASAQRRKVLCERARRKLMPTLMAELDGDAYFRLRNATYPVGFVGLMEACMAFSGELPHEGGSGLKVALELLRAMRKGLEAYWTRLEMRCSPSATCASGVATRLARLDVEKYGWSKVKVLSSREEPKYTSGCLTPNNACLDLEERLRMEALLHRETPGGHLLFVAPDELRDGPEGLARLTMMALEEGVKAIAYPREITYCSACARAFRGHHPKCPSCGRVSTISRYVRRAEGYVKVVGGGERTW
ncbi:hypothetical protein DRO60_00905 [Candidatus Bathyarchaeota archaeon]|nr:MAG: hypothetical protein DRO60_00905 [Candidatus Bathyarchaeota archaeon]